MAKIIRCEDMEFECDYLCAPSEEELISRAALYAKASPTPFGELASEIRDRVREVIKDVDHC